MAIVRQWTNREIEKLRQLSKELNSAEMAKTLGRSQMAITTKLKDLGITTTRKKRRVKRYWTEKEIDFLSQNYNDLGISQIAKKLNRSYSSVSNKAKKLGLMANSQSQKLEHDPDKDLWQCRICKKLVKSEYYDKKQRYCYDCKKQNSIERGKRRILISIYPAVKLAKKYKSLDFKKQKKLREKIDKAILDIIEKELT